MPATTYNQLEDQIRVWAERHPAVRALAVFGSRARVDHPAVEWSDLDLILFVNGRQEFVGNNAWLENFGEVWLNVLQATGAGDPEWLVLFDGGLKVDFLLVEAGESIEEILYGSRFDVVSRRGVRVLVDKGETDPGAITMANDGPAPPPPMNFAAAVQLFWITAHRAATMLRNGELWRARRSMDGELRQQLEQLVAWHARAKEAKELDTWYGGRFMDEWADPDALGAIPELFAPFEQHASAEALLEMLALVSWLSEETAVRQGHPYPAASIKKVRGWIEKILREMA